MNEPPPESLDLDDLRAIDAICGPFEAALQSGNKRDIEDQLQKVLPHQVDALLFELIRLELEYCHPEQRESLLKSLRERFPDHNGPIDRAVARVQGDASGGDKINNGLPASERSSHVELRSGRDVPARIADMDATLDIGEGGRNRDFFCMDLPDYALLSELGRGGMGVVFKALQMSLDRQCAVKFMSRVHFASSRDIERFEREAMLSAKQQHPGIVQVFDFGEVEGIPYFSMEYVEGQNLAERIRKHPLSSQAAAKMLREICDAIHYAHGKGVVHRDLKPANILIDTQGRTHVTDFGLARSVIDDSKMTSMGDVLGTPSYMSPEQARGDVENVGVRSDVYSLGAILYETIVGRPPFRAETAAATIEQVKTALPVPPRELNPEVARDLDTICLKCLDKLPSKRYQTVQELADDLQRYLDGRPIQARPVSQWERFWRWSMRNPALACTASALVIALLLGTVISTFFGVAARKEARKVIESREEERRRAIELAGQRGGWEESLRLCNSSLAANAKDPTWFRIERVRALDALQRADEARQEIEQMAGADIPDAYRGTVLLWQADLALLVRDTPETRQLIEEARQLGLSPADDAYARALLAERTVDAIAALETCLEHRRYDQKAMRQLALCLATVGRHEEAQLQTAVAARLFPEDPSFTVVSAMSMSMQGDLAAAEQALLPLEDRVGKGAMRQLSDYLTMINRFGELLPNALNGGAEFVEAERLAQALLGQAYGKNQLLPDLQLQAPRCLFNAFGSFGSILRIQPDDANGFLAVAANLENAAEGHPDGLLYFVAAMPYVDQGKFSEAEERYGKAARMPLSFPSVYPQAVFGAMMCALAVHGQTGDEEMLKRAVEWAKKWSTLGTVDPFQFRSVSQTLVRGGELEMGLDVAEEAVRCHADNADLLLNAADLAMRAGHFARALELASQLLDKEPGHEGAAGIRDRATEELAKLIESKDRRVDAGA